MEDLMKVQDVGKFYQKIAFVVAKLKVLKVFCTKSASMLGPFLGAFVRLVLQKWSYFAKLCSRATFENFWETFEKTEPIRERDGPKVGVFGPPLNPLYALKMAKIEKYVFLGKPLTIGLSKYATVQALSSLPFAYSYFLLYLGYFW